MPRTRLRTTLALVWLASLAACGGGAPPSPSVAVPTGLTTTAVTATTVALSWTPSYDAIAYDVYKGSSLATSATTSAAVLDRLTPSTTYTFTVKARDAAGRESAASSAVTVTTAPPGTDTTPPSAPYNPQATATGGTVVISWSASTDDVGVVGYELFFGTQLLTTTETTSVALMGFAPGTTYTFTIKAYDNAGNVSAGSQVTVTIDAAAAPTAPSTADRQ